MENNFNNNRANENKVAEAAAEVMEAAAKKPFLKTKTGKVITSLGIAAVVVTIGTIIYRRVKKAKETILVVEETQEEK